MCIKYILFLNRPSSLHKNQLPWHVSKNGVNTCPQFRSNLFVALKLIPIMIANVRRDLHFSNKWRIKFPFCPSNQGYKYLHLLLCQHFSCSTSLPSLSLKNTPAPPPSAQPKRPLGFEDSSSRITRSANGVHLRYPRGTFISFTLAFAFNLSSDFPFAPLISTFLV